MSEINYNVRKLVTDEWPPDIVYRAESVLLALAMGAELVIAKFLVCETDARCVGDS